MGMRPKPRCWISIHALREEGDAIAKFLDRMMRLFLSTPSARRATIPLSISLVIPRYFYPRPPRGGRRLQQPSCRPPQRISIHALREEGDGLPA